MNLVGHVAVTVVEDPAPSADFLVGCMLPDLAAIARVRVSRPGGDMGRGVEYHHACDAAFHDSAWFLGRTVELRDELLDVGVERGPARACAHAGLEMLLDGAFLHDDRVQSRVRHTLRAVGDRARDLALLAPEDSRRRWHERLRMISTSLDPAAYADAAAITLRLQRMTAGRTRIEVRADQAAVITTVLAGAQPEVLAAAPDVLDSVRREVTRGGHA